MFKVKTSILSSLAALSLVITCSANAGEVLDRIVATVNGQIILQSDWQQALRYEAFASARTMEKITATDRKAALDRLIDQELLRQQMRASDAPAATAQEVANRIAEIRKQYLGADSEQEWQRVLKQYGLAESELQRRVALEIELLGLVDARLRPGVNIDSASIESYYSRQLLPQLRQEGAKTVPLAEVTPKIKELLTQEKVSELLVAWLQTLRAGSEIETLSMAPDSSREAR